MTAVPVDERRQLRPLVVAVVCHHTAVAVVAEALHGPTFVLIILPYEYLWHLQMQQCCESFFPYSMAFIHHRSTTIIASKVNLILIYLSVDG